MLAESLLQIKNLKRTDCVLLTFIKRLCISHLIL